MRRRSSLTRCRRPWRLAEFTGYLDRPNANPFADSASYRQFALWLSAEERAEFIAEVRALIVARARNVQTPDRRKHLLTTIMFPTT